MFELTNEQRRCFGLAAVEPHWKRIEAKPGPYDKNRMFLYLDGSHIVKCIIIGETMYMECGLDEQLSDDEQYLLPKTAKGKPVRLSMSTIAKRTNRGMTLVYQEDWISLYNANTDCAYFTSAYIDLNLKSVDDFARWVEAWCADTTESDLEDLQAFLAKKRRRVRFKDGDVFRYKIDRRHYGYGRILLDYNQMRKHGEYFWDILMSKPLVCSAYHIITDRDDVIVDELRGLQSLPSCIVADNNLYYGEYEIIGSIPITDHEDYPIMYGNSIAAGERAVCYQQGRMYRCIKNERALYRGYINNSVSFRMNVRKDVLRECIAAGSNEPYWRLYYPRPTDRDLRNPKNHLALRKIKQQFGL